MSLGLRRKQVNDGLEVRNAEGRVVRGRSAEGASEGSQVQGCREAAHAAPGSPNPHAVSPERAAENCGDVFICRPFGPEFTFVVDPGAARCALAPGYLMPRLRRFYSHLTSQKKRESRETRAKFQHQFVFAI